MIRKYKNRIAFVSLMVMFLFKIVSVETFVHDYSHRAQEDYNSFSDNEENPDEQDGDCELCIVLFEAALTPFTCEFVPAFDVLPVLLAKEEAQKLPELLFTNDLFASDLSNRPPPSFS